MGYFSELDIEMQENQDVDLQETELDFDKRNYTDGSWWAEQDAELHAEEMKRLEEEADIFALRQGGYL